jgi:hypothetical protein
VLGVAVSDLATFLARQLDEDERVAREATAGPWRVIDERGDQAEIESASTVYEWEHWNKGQPAAVVSDCDGCGAVAVKDAHHIARHDPARVLADVASKRKILALHSEATGFTMGYTENFDYGRTPNACNECGTADEYAVPWPCPTLRALAQPYAGAEGWQEAWADE